MRKGLIFVLFFICVISTIHFYRDALNLSNLVNQKKINKILIINNKYFSEENFMSKLSIYEGDSFYKFNPFTLRKELDKIDEIKNYKFEMSFDGILTIIINAKSPFMIWHKENKYVFIDNEGNPLNYDYYSKEESLIDLYGNNADDYISSLKDYLNLSVIKNIKIQKISFNEDLGWKFYLTRSKCFYLPIKKLDIMIDIFENIIVSDLYHKYKFFDFRILGRVYMSNNKC